MIKAMKSVIPNNIFKSPAIRLIVTAFTCCLLFNCQSPIEKVDTKSDLIEFESVWQYLKAYSIHQENIPPDPFVFKTTDLLMEAVHDTLKSMYQNYTCYYKVPLGKTSANLSNRTATPEDHSTVFFDRITSSTACITVTAFEDSTWFNFRDSTKSAAPYTNIIIDLRDNLGGRIDILDSLAAAIVPLGTPYILARFREKDDKTKKFVTREWDTLKTTTGPMRELAGKKYVVLMNGMTASASEILAAAIFEGTHANLIGSTSYGKGMGQIILDRRTRDPLQITFLYLKGRSERIGDYHRKGIAPDTVPDSIKNAADSTWSQWKKEIFYAAKMLDPTTKVSPINFPPQRFKTSMSKESSGLYKVIKEE